MKKLYGWNISCRQKLRKKIADCKRSLSAVNNEEMSDFWDETRKIENRLDCLLEKEENYWRQRSIIDWLKRGDKNTRFFHWKTSNRRARNRISVLWDSGGN
ncbi:hypothetical protein Ddye_029673 [Dipteronia dyeriana]|uniref:Uncharacterized protein n=1 Tax=Dipteronia dyeriana TaxID=168575 RepID=A0AAD9TFM5_9ROSI|nr:hypothetical protein Ddye_029673 [Dipteronia dyeriana]